MFMGEYHLKLDEKNRITVPAKVRYDLGEEFIITRGLDNCLFIYPKDEWNNVISKYKELPNTKDARNFMRFFLSGATMCECDLQGRVNISSVLTEYANLKKECIVIGVNERLEIWDKDSWEKFIHENEDSLSDIADSLFKTTLN